MAVAVPTDVSSTGTVLYEWGEMNLHIVPPPDAFTLGYGNRSATLLKPTFRSILPLKPFLIDIRLDAYSERQEWNADALMARLTPRYYCHLRALGNVNHTRRYLGVELADEGTGIAYVREVIALGYTPILMCACGDPKGCHRTDVANKLTALGHTVNELDLKGNL